MSKILQVKNVTIYSSLQQSLSVWNRDINLQFQPDEIILRQISYHGVYDRDGIFLIWSSIINDFIGTFSIYNQNVVAASNIGCNITPNTAFKCAPNSINNSLKFQIFTMDSNGTPFHTSSLTGKLILNFDFIKYKSN